MKRALVLSLICVLGLAFGGLAASLSGEWDTTITINPGAAWAPGNPALASSIKVVYEVGDWSFTSLTGLTHAGWTSQEFDADGVLGAFTIGSILIFDPAGVAFTSWNTDVGVSIAGVTFGFDFTLYPGNVALELTMAGMAGDVNLDAKVTFGNPLTVGIGGCDLDWTGITVGVDFPFCCGNVVSTVVFDCTGFVSATFGVVGIAVPNLPWLEVDASVLFKVDEKVVTLTPKYVGGLFDCISLDIDIAYVPPATGVGYMIEGFEISAIAIECILDGVTFTGKTWFDGSEEYFEQYTIKTDDDGCCGPFNFELGLYFADLANTLFDLALVDVEMSIDIASQFTFTMGMQIDLEAPGFTLWELGFEVTW